MAIHIAWEETFDVNKVDDEEPIFRLVRNHRRKTYSAPDYNLAMAPVANKGAFATMIDGVPRDGEAEIDFFALPNGVRLRIKAIQHEKSNRPSDATNVVPYTQELASIIKQTLLWAPIQPARDADRREWYEYRYQVVVRLGRKLPYREMIEMMGLEWPRDYDSVRQGFSRFKAEVYGEGADDEKLSQDVTGL